MLAIVRRSPDPIADDPNFGTTYPFPEPRDGAPYVCAADEVDLRTPSNGLTRDVLSLAVGTWLSGPTVPAVANGSSGGTSEIGGHVDQTTRKGRYTFPTCRRHSPERGHGKPAREPPTAAYKRDLPKLREYLPQRPWLSRRWVGIVTQSPGTSLPDQGYRLSWPSRPGTVLPDRFVTSFLLELPSQTMKSENCTRRFVCVWRTAVQAPTSEMGNYVTPTVRKPR